jgi:hypothetical protein
MDKLVQRNSEELESNPIIYMTLERLEGASRMSSAET